MYSFYKIYHFLNNASWLIQITRYFINIFQYYKYSNFIILINVFYKQNKETKYAKKSDALKIMCVIGSTNLGI